MSNPPFSGCISKVNQCQFISNRKPPPCYFENFKKNLYPQITSPSSAPTKIIREGRVNTKSNLNFQLLILYQTRSYSSGKVIWSLNYTCFRVFGPTEQFQKLNWNTSDYWLKYSDKKNCYSTVKVIWGQVILILGYLGH